MLLRKTGEVVGLVEVRDELNEELLESVVLHEMGIPIKKHRELSAETRKNLQDFYIKYADVFRDLSMLVDGK